jgi:Fe-S cluster biogenesis protein NfuA
MALASSWVTLRASRVLGSLLVREQIETLIREVLSPLFEADGASLELVDIVDKVVRIRVGGSYRGCPSVPYTLEGVVIPALRRAAGTDVQVELVH